MASICCSPPEGFRSVNTAGAQRRQQLPDVVEAGQIAAAAEAQVVERRQLVNNERSSVTCPRPARALADGDVPARSVPARGTTPVSVVRVWPDSTSDVDSHQRKLFRSWLGVRGR